MVVRVDESPQAPHAVEKGTQVVVYERVESVSRRYTFAHIDRIKYLLDRRRQQELDRERYIQEAITRCKRYLNAPALAVRWASIIPLFPWRQICDPELCYTLHSHALGRDVQVQRFPEGSFGLAQGGRSVSSRASRRAAKFSWQNTPMRASRITWQRRMASKVKTSWNLKEW